MEKTYTYTARSANDPVQVVTFTLYERSLTIEPGSPARVEQVLRSTLIKSETESEANNPSNAWLRALAVLEGLDRPRLDLADVDAGVERDGLRLMAWGRARDHRWLPITIVIEHVDNPEAARAFVKELNRRKMSALRREHFLAWMGARAYWFLAGSLTALVAVISLRSRRS